MKYFIITVIAIILASCTNLNNVPNDLKPLNRILFSQMPEDAPEEYKDGWKRGCESGMAAYGNDYYASFYQMNTDVTKTTDEVYYKAWLDSYNYCRRFVMSWLREAGIRAKMPNEDYSNLGDGGIETIGSTWGVGAINNQNSFGGIGSGGIHFGNSSAKDLTKSPGLFDGWGAGWLGK